MSHLGERVSALVDGQLSAEATERAMSHLARCRPCRDEVETERLMKARLACLAGPEPSGDLVGRLLAMGGPSGPMPPRPGHVPGTPRPQPVPLSRPEPVAVPAAAPVPASFAPALHTPSRTLAVVGLAVRRRPVLRRPDPRPPARPAGSRPAGRPSGPGLVRRARLAGAVIGALGVVGAGVGGLVLAAPSVPGGVGADTLTVQRQSATASPGGVRRGSTSLIAKQAPAGVPVPSPSDVTPSGSAAEDPQDVLVAVLGADMTGLPPTPGLYHHDR